LQAVSIKNVIYVTSPENAREFKTPGIRLGCDVAGAVHKNALLTRVLDDFALRGLGWVIDSNVRETTRIRITAKWHNCVEADVA
ncbi:hypothetical protein NL533_33775, partial [Klebsiella pneumoniae]|nr:hypothetical protein [Klebsiella pneumoniae]